MPVAYAKRDLAAYEASLTLGYAIAHFLYWSTAR